MDIPLDGAKIAVQLSALHLMEIPLDGANRLTLKSTDAGYDINFLGLKCQCSTLNVVISIYEL